MNEIKLVNNSNLMDVKQAAEFLGLKVSSIYKLVMTKAIPYYKLGRLVKFKRSELESWLTKCKVEARQSDYHTASN